VKKGNNTAINTGKINVFDEVNEFGDRVLRQVAAYEWNIKRALYSFLNRCVVRPWNWYCPLHFVSSPTPLIAISLKKFNFYALCMSKVFLGNSLVNRNSTLRWIKWKFWNSNSNLIKKIANSKKKI